MSDLVTLDFDGPVAVISNNRPDKHNAANDAMDQLLFARLKELHGRPGLRAVVWRGNGRSFSYRARTSRSGAIVIS